MASFVGSAPLRRAEWTVADAARFAALKEFDLLKVLSTDAKALATARRPSRGVDGGETATGVLMEGGGGCERIFTPLERLC